MSDPDQLLARLAALPAHDVGAAQREAIRHAAEGILARERRLAARPYLAFADALYGRLLEPALVAATVALYLSWALRTVLALHG